MVAAAGLHDSAVRHIMGTDRMGRLHTMIPDTTAGTIRLEDAGAIMGGQTVWRHVTGSFRPGSMTAIAGANGTGKSTLLRAILGEVPLAHGTVTRGGLGPRDFGYLPQARIIDRGFPISVTDMVLGGAWQQTGLFGRADRTVRLRAANALHRVNLDGQAQRMIAALSAGQFQRLLFARLLMTDARVIVLDEPFTALDAPTTQDLLELVCEWHTQGRTIIAVLHDIHQIRTCFPDVVLLHDGQATWGRTPDILTPVILQRAYGGTRDRWADMPS
ncbi:metal ABC transporter ATP-binding protein [Komagataeibacter diospyri]|uniref:Ferrichrome ABC transporter ATP-binding protein n=1 Tax=Komagataeibacter diospyri TaxID=1932662 RepID=A0A4P5NQH7_9PROT|nr:ATP-binding cassette domain-containing protein [Komagataeibacter diospyri]GCE83898.1 ferrichrome ABC transporter ATP-binding protein [Komagataeibacter diospyri]